MKEYLQLCSLLGALFYCISVDSIALPIQWIKNKVTKTYKIPKRDLAILDKAVANHTSSARGKMREVVFDNNITDFFAMLAEDPFYKNIHTLIDDTIIINGLAIPPYTQAPVTVYNEQCQVTLRLRHGMAAYIAQFMTSVDRKLVKTLIAPLVRKITPMFLSFRQCATHFHIPTEINNVALSDIVLTAYGQLQVDASNLKYKLQWPYFVDLEYRKVLSL